MPFVPLSNRQDDEEVVPQRGFTPISSRPPSVSPPTVESEQDLFATEPPYPGFMQGIKTQNREYVALDRPGFFDRTSAAFESHDGLSANLLKYASDFLPQVDPVTGKVMRPDENRKDRVLRELVAKRQLAMPEAETFGEKAADFLGAAGSEIVDPTAIAAGGVGATLRGLARLATLSGVGGAYEGASAIAEQMADHGEVVDAGNVGIRAGTGAVAAPVLDLLIRVVGTGFKKLWALRSKQGADTGAIDEQIGQGLSAVFEEADKTGVARTEAAQMLARVIKTPEGDVVAPSSDVIRALPGESPIAPTEAPLRTKEGEVLPVENAHQQEQGKPAADYQNLANEYERLARATSDESVRTDLLAQADRLRRQRVAEIEDAKPKLSAKERARQRAQQMRKVDESQDDLITAIRKLGGINVAEDSDWAGRLKHLSRRVPGLPGIEQTSGAGRSLDDLAELLYGRGYLKSRDKKELEDLLWRAENGENFYSSARQMSDDEIAQMDPNYGRPPEDSNFGSDSDYTFHDNDVAIDDTDAEFVIRTDAGTIVPARPLDEDDLLRIDAEIRAHEEREAELDAYYERERALEEGQGERETGEPGQTEGFRLSERSEDRVPQRASIEPGTGAETDFLPGIDKPRPGEQQLADFIRQKEAAKAPQGYVAPHQGEGDLFNPQAGAQKDLLRDGFKIESPDGFKPYSPSSNRPLLFLPADADLPTRKAALDTFGRKVKHVETGTFPTGISRIRNSADLAHVIAPIRKDAQESFVTVVTDDAGNVLRIAKLHKGSQREASVDPTLVAGVAANTKGAKAAWIAHNHPTGGVSQSEADKVLTSKIHDLLRGSGVELKGSVAIAPGGKVHSLFGEGVELNSVPTNAQARSGVIPVTERRLVGQETPHEPIESVDQAHAVMNELGNNQDGVLLVDAQSRPVGFLPMTVDEMRTLRSGEQGGSQRLLQALDETQADGFFVRSDSEAVAGNMNAFASATKKRLVDVVDSSGKSHQTKEGIPEQSTFYSNPFGVAAKEIARDFVREPGRNLAAAIAGGTYAGTTSEHEMGSPEWWLDVGKGGGLGLLISQGGRAAKLWGPGSIADKGRVKLGNAIERLPLIGRGPAEVRELKRKQRLMRQLLDRQTEEVGKFLLKNFSPSERAQMADLIENRGIIQDFNLVHRQAAILDDYLVQAGERMKELGMLPEELETGGYLHRYYAKHLGLDKDFRLAKGQTLSGSYSIARGKDELIDRNYMSPRAQSVMNQVDEVRSEIQTLEKSRSDLLGADNNARLNDLRAQLRDLKKKELVEYTGGENGKLRSFFFLKDEVARLAREDGSIVGFEGGPGPGLDPTLGPVAKLDGTFSPTERVWSIRGTRKGQALLHRDWTDAERHAWGEIKDAGYRYVRGMGEVSHDLSLATLYKTVADRSAWASKDPIPNWKQVPVTAVGGSPMKRYGALAGMYVRPDVWNGISRYGRNLKVLGPVGDTKIPGTGVTIDQFYRASVNKWKLYKTVYNPVTHLNNAFSNVEMLYMAGYSPFDLAKAFNLARQNEKSDVWVEARENGLFGADWSSSITSADGGNAKAIADLADELLKQPEIPDAILSTDIMMRAKEWYINSRNAVSEADGKFASGAAIAKAMREPALKGLKVSLKPVTAAGNAAQKLYRFEDEIFKLAVYQAERAKGKSPEQSVTTAQQFFFDYNDLPTVVKAMRDFPVGSPFISYTYLAIPAIARNVVHHPERVLALVAAYEGMNYAALSADGEAGPGEYWAAEEAQNTASPPWDKGRAAWGARNTVNLPNVPYLPSLDGYRLSMARMHAMGNPFMAESGNRAASVPYASWWGSDLLGSNPSHALYDILINEDWRGKPIYKEGATAEDKRAALANYLYQAWSPSNPLTPGGYHQQKIIEGLATDKARAESAGEDPGLAGFVVETANGVAEALGMQGFTGIDGLGYEIESRDAILGSLGVKLRPQRFAESISFEKQDIEKAMKDKDRWLDSKALLANKGRLSESQLEKYRAQYERDIQRLNDRLNKINEAEDYLTPSP
ncbi:MAG: JAB domain-containing protein [Gammaproteobacteria bacterium]|nr:JAB domain-containing protein [Gammaproteobacteria bacterium]